MTEKNTATTHGHFKDLLLLFAIPIAVSIVIGLMLYIPRMLAQPKTNFIYAVCDGYYCMNDFEVGPDGHIRKLIQDETLAESKQSAELRYYDTTDDSSRSISIDQATKYKLNTSSKSPDGYTLTKENKSDGFLLMYNDDSGWFLKDGIKTKQVKLTANEEYYSQDITFMGWVMQ